MKLLTNLKEASGKARAGLTLATTSGYLALTSLPVYADGVLDYDTKTGTVQGSTNLADTGTKLQTTGKSIYYIFVALSLIVCMGFLVKNAVKLARSADNAQDRSRAIAGIIGSIAAFAIIGGAATIAGWMYGIFNE